MMISSMLLKVEVGGKEEIGKMNKQLCHELLPHLFFPLLLPSLMFFHFVAARPV